MKTLEKKFRLLLVIGMIAILGLASCETEDDENETPQPNEEQTIVDVASSDDTYSTLVAALQKADLASTLQGDGPFTVFAPTNEAFESLLQDLGVSSLDDLTADQLEPILLYHVVSGKVMSTDLSNGYVKSLSPGPGNTQADILVNIDNGVSLNSSSNVTAADVDASNGIIHQIDKVILPPNVVDIASDNSDFSTLVDAVVKAELAETLSGDGPFTIFAPTNQAFQDLLNELGASSLDDLSKEDLLPILNYHVVSGNVLSSDLSSGNVTTIGGKDIAIDVGNSVTINGSSNVTAVDIQGINGVIHVIDEVLLPEDAPKNIVETAMADEQFSILVDALSKADLVGALEGDGPFTVFVPTNQAFQNLLSDLGASSLDDVSVDQLASILLYHVVSGKVMSGDLSTGYVSTLSGGPNDTYVSLLAEVDGGVTLNGSSTVTAADVEATNGVIHVIDEVLLPPNVVDIAINNSSFSILVDAVVKAELAETLSGDGPFTVFAPTNAAFEDLFTQLGVNGISDLTKEDLVPILQYHVVSGNVRSGDLSSGTVSTLNGDISVDVGDQVTINTDATVTLADVQGTNGVVHVIDKVLVPSSE
ncbi:MAG TPA: fasciclin domain-containing protein [Bacteroidales bacterium]|nr:fasciclin domain-containing protein [Bacteroidales bacterium]